MFPQYIRYNIYKYTIWIRWFLFIGITPLLVLIIYFGKQLPEVFEAEKINRLIISSFFLTIFIFFYNLLFLVFERLRKNEINFQNIILKLLSLLIYNFIFDIIAASWLVYNSGGSSSILLPMFFIIILFAAVTHPPKIIINIGIFAFLLINIIFFLDQTDAFPLIDIFNLYENLGFADIFSGLAAFSFDTAFAASIFIAVIISRIISEKENSLISEKDRFASLIENLRDGIVVLDNKNYIIFINKAAEEIFGIHKHEALNKQIDLEMYENSKFKNLIRVILLKTENTEGGWIKPTEINLLSPGQIPVQVYSINIHEKNDMVSVMKVVRDISREKEVERMKNEFIFIAAHQLRTPLSAIKWVFSMILGGDIGKITLEQKDILDKGETATQRMIDLVNDLLNVSRIEEGKFDYNFEEISLYEIIQKTADIEKNKIRERELNFKIIMRDENIPKIKGDKEKLLLVFQNLIENAINYTFKKGSVIINLKSDNENVIAEIEDNGIGIPKSQLNRLFNKFFRGSNVIKMQMEGTGLGLFIAKNIIEKHHGKIEVESEEGKGTKIIIFFPALKK